MVTTRDSSDEEERERYRELLEELRTILPGVQVLLAFLLTVPFASRFPELDRFAQLIFGLSLAGVTAAVVVLLAPAAFHRLGKRRDRRDPAGSGSRRKSSAWACSLCRSPLTRLSLRASSPAAPCGA